MTAIVAHNESTGIWQARRTQVFSSPVTLRGLLLIGCLASVATAVWLGDPLPYIHADPELARLLRGMALIKAAMVLTGLAVLTWRFGRPISGFVAATCLVSAWLAAGASMLVWQLTFIPVAAGAFHAGELTLLFLAWRAHRSGRESLPSLG